MQWARLVPVALAVPVRDCQAMPAAWSPLRSVLSALAGWSGHPPRRLLQVSGYPPFARHPAPSSTGLVMGLLARDETVAPGAGETRPLSALIQAEQCHPSRTMLLDCQVGEQFRCSSSLIFNPCRPPRRRYRLPDEAAVADTQQQPLGPSEEEESGRSVTSKTSARRAACHTVFAPLPHWLRSLILRRTSPDLLPAPS